MKISTIILAFILRRKTAKAESEYDIIYIYIYIYIYIFIYLFIYLFIIGFIYRPHVLTPQSGRKVRESGT